MEAALYCKKKLFSLLLLLIYLTFCFTSCNSKQLTTAEINQYLSEQRYLDQSLEMLSETIVHDIFSPPVASRLYVYPCIAAYQSMLVLDSNDNSILDNLNTYTRYRTIDQNSNNLSLELVAIESFLFVAKALVFSDDRLEHFHKDIIDDLRQKNVNQAYFDKSQELGRLIGQHIMDYAAKDNYKMTRSMPKHNISNEVAAWKPTPPAYMDGIEPHWNKIRPIAISSMEPFIAKPPTTFDLSKDSPFYKELLEVKEVTDNLTEDQAFIASFWDCNPYALKQSGHVNYALKKITPGGHWMGIASIAAKQSELNMLNSAYVYSVTSIALFDSFISCWDEKYRSNLVRPETLIHEFVDAEWAPILQTPPFPEHTSGHSVISTAASRVLSSIFGNNYSYIDDVEVKYGLQERAFTSFNSAADEAAISRLYGGIHYRPAIEIGKDQGELIGKYIIDKLKITPPQYN